MLDAHGAEHHAVRTRTEAAVDLLHRAQPAARLHGNAELCDALDDFIEPARFAERAREIDDVQDLCARIHPAAGTFHGIAVIGDGVPLPVQKAHGAPLQYVDRGI